MIQVYHGKDIFKSRQQLAKDLEKYSKVDYISRKKINSENLVKHSGGLFATPKKQALVLEGLFSLQKKPLLNIFKQVKKLNSNIDFFIWQGEKVSSSKLNIAKDYQSKIKHFKLPNHLFNFLDQLGKGSLSKSIKLFNKLKMTHPPELILYFLQKRAKKMYLAKKNEALLKLPGWQKQKILNQIKNLTADEIEAFYLSLVNVDWLNKTGKLGCTLENKLLNLIIELESNHEKYI